MIPSVLDEENIETIPHYITNAVKNCKVFFVENERTARRFLKKLMKEIVIDDYEWHTLDGKIGIANTFTKKLKENSIIGIISEAGCPGVADPGQELVAIAQQLNVTVKPLVGPNSIILALMASGLNGQVFRFNGYLPINENDRSKKLIELEQQSRKQNCTELFIETPYRNNQLLSTILKNCNNSTLISIAVDLTGKNEWIRTRKVSEWKKEVPEIHKRPAIFLLLAT